MSDKAVTVTTRQAAELLDVHESSIKRWCSQNQLTCFQTPGGHRRIPFDALMDFSQTKGIACELQVFDAYAEAVWEGLLDAEKKKDFQQLADLGAHWIQGPEFYYMLKLLTLLKRQGYPLSAQMDKIIAPIMRTVGDAYLNGDLSIGNEHRITYLMRDLLVRMSTGSEWADRTPNAPEKSRPRAVLGCIRSQAHELGCLMAKLVLESHGWDVVYLGLNVPSEDFSRAQIEYDASLVCIALMPPSTYPEVYHVIDLLEQVYDRNRPYHLVFGGPVELQLDPNRTTKSSISSIQYFETMSKFSDWLENTSDDSTSTRSYATSSGRDNNSLKRSFR
ncbi:MAG: cobalamin-dependent protein [Rhodothermaceae bacterium]|nr:cobalamin-dependent protein [Rhodothermaceae bacterium]